LQDFEYHRPKSVAAAVEALCSGEARALAGGTDLIPQLREGRRLARHLVDLKRIPELTAIAVLPDGGISIGAAATLTSIAQHPSIAARYPSVAQSAQLVGSLQVQNRASLGGNICNAAPSADAVPPLICYEARATITGRNRQREMAVGELFRGPGRTFLDADELLTTIILPPPPTRSAARYLRFTPRREMDIAIAGAGVWLSLDARGSVAAARIVLASVGPTPMRAHAAEAALLGERPSETLLIEAGRIAAGEAQPISDTRGSADYRRELVSVLTKRALSDCCAQLKADGAIA
jgi:CO/xanthine dehydrogenase FAD-binding subunit